MSYATLRYEVEDQIATITLSRPEMLNAFTVEMSGEISAALDRADADPEVRAVIFTGEGRAFCAGMDLSSDGNVFGLDESVATDDAAAMERNRDLGGTITLRIFRMKKPVIAAINGAGVGIGATMTLPMDARICSTKARIGFVFARIGVCMEAASSWFLPRLVGMQTALDWAMSAEILTADKLLAGGFCTKVVEPEDLMAEARATARRYIDGLSPVSVAVNRQLLWRMAGASHPMEAHKLDSRAIYEMSMADGKEGVRSFIEKRPAEYQQTPPSGMPPFFDWDDEPGWG